MIKPININSKGAEVNLIAREYRIYVLGGWGIDLGSFKISFRDKKTNEITKPKRTILPVQAYSYGKRAKRIFVVNIPKQSSYEVIFENSESLKVKRSNLFFSSMFMKSISNNVSNKNIEILITEELGFSPIIS